MAERTLDLKVTLDARPAIRSLGKLQTALWGYSLGTLLLILALGLLVGGAGMAAAIICSCGL